MSSNHYLTGVTKISKDVFQVGDLVATRTYPRREGVVGGAAQAYKDEKGSIIGYTLADVRKVAAARAKQPSDPDDLGMTMIEIHSLITKTQKEIKPCPCCQAGARLSTTDYMTYAITCSDMDCRLKVQRGLINERGPKECIALVLYAWNKRPALLPEKIAKHIAGLTEAAQEACDWLAECTPGTDQHERGMKLKKALKPFTIK